jgi:hypothetical protein
MHVVIDLDGVLKGDKNDEPILTGVQFVGALSAYNKITFITELSKGEAEQWVNVNKIVDFDEIFDSSLKLEGDDLKERQLKFVRSRGPIDLFITSSPKLWVCSFDLGIPSMMFGVPGYIRPEFRPDAPKKVRAWDEIEAAVKKQNELRTKDARLTRAEGVTFP